MAGHSTHAPVISASSEQFCARARRPPGPKDRDPAYLAELAAHAIWQGTCPGRAMLHRNGAVGFMHHNRPVVAIFNAGSDVVDLLRTFFEQKGFFVVTAGAEEIQHGGMDLEGFIRRHRPEAVVYEIAPPYDHNWAFLLNLTQERLLADIAVVPVTMNAWAAWLSVTGARHVYEIHDLDRLLAAVRKGPPAIRCEA